MSDAVPAPSADPDPVPGASPRPSGQPGPSGPPPTGPPPTGPPPTGPRKPRKRFLIAGIVVAIALGIGLFTGVGTGTGKGSSAPSVGDAVPTFSADNVGSAGPRTVSVSPSTTGGQPTVLLFFGAWCPSCHTELPPLAAMVRAQQQAGGALSRVHVVGVDSLDSRPSAIAFVKQEGVTFPVAWDPETHITNDDFFFTGDPYAVFVNADGTIAKIVRGDVLTPPSLLAEERALLPTPSGT